MNAAVGLRNQNGKGLKILQTKKGGAGDDVGTVEFVATYVQAGKGVDHHEVSQFRRAKNGHWVFIDGDSHTHPEGEGHHHPVKVETHRRTEPKIGRNDPCPCGSGSKLQKVAVGRWGSHCSFCGRPSSDVVVVSLVCDEDMFATLCAVTRGCWRQVTLNFDANCGAKT